MSQGIAIAVIVLVSGSIGWFTNFIAVRFLFKPRKAINFLGWKIQGVFPKRKQEVALKIAEMILEIVSMEEIVSVSLKKWLAEKETDEVIQEKINVFLNEKLGTLFPMAKMFLSPQMINSISESLVKEIKIVLPELLENFKKDADKNFNLKKELSEKINSFSDEKFEKILLNVLKKEFRFIEILGLVMGALIGVGQGILFFFLEKS